MNLTEQHKALLLSKRREWENVAILAIRAAFKNTPINEHQQLLDSIYTQIIQQVFHTPGEGSPLPCELSTTHEAQQ
jgi:hypothetical protein